MKTLYNNVCSLKMLENGYAQDTLTTAVCEGTIKLKINLRKN